MSFESASDLLDRSRPRVRNLPARNARKRVVMDAGRFRDRPPGSPVLARLKGCDYLREAHLPTLSGTSALDVKAILHRLGVDDSEVPQEKPEPTVFQANLLRLIGAESVNAWALRHDLEQTTIQRLVHGQDPRLSMVQKIADAVGVPAWQLLVKTVPKDGTLSSTNEGGIAGQTDVELWRRVDELTRTVNQLKQEAKVARGNSSFGDLDEAAGSGE